MSRVFHTKSRNMRILGNVACLQFTHHGDDADAQEKHIFCQGIVVYHSGITQIFVAF
jgi:hypothetical protein